MCDSGSLGIGGIDLGGEDGCKYALKPQHYAFNNLEP